MIELRESLSKDVRPRDGQSRMLDVIRRVIKICDDSQQNGPDPAIAYEINKLHSLEDAVAKQWPLHVRVKSTIDVGPFAAKNIEDWDPVLAEMLVRLDFSIQHDGAKLGSVLSKDHLSMMDTTEDDEATLDETPDARGFGLKGMRSRHAAVRVTFYLLVALSAVFGAMCGLMLVYSVDLPQMDDLVRYRPKHDEHAI